MKKMLFILAVAALSAVSCSKDRTCTCTDEKNNSSATTLVGVSNGQAKANCVSTKSVDSKGNPVSKTCVLK